MQKMVLVLMIKNVVNQSKGLILAYEMTANFFRTTKGLKKNMSR